MSDAQTLALLIPAYNAARHLPRLLRSAALQTEAFDEIWVYDDASTDDTGAVAKRLGARVLRGEFNRGCSHAKNVLARATGCGWLHFHDADDDLKPDFVALSAKWRTHGRHDVVLFSYEELDDATGARLAIRRFDAAAVAADARRFAIREQINPFCGLYRRFAYLAAGGYDEDPLVLFNEDVAFHIRLAFAGLSFAVEPEIAIVNRRRRDSMSAAHGARCVQAQFHVMRKTAERPDAARYRADIARRLWNIAAVAASYRDWPSADAAAALAVKLAGASAAGRSRLFRALAAASPRVALRAREAMLRGLRPPMRVAPAVPPALAQR
jgi:glycosyltransferase involved in cell wall biosynthesis